MQSRASRLSFFLLMGLPLAMAMGNAACSSPPPPPPAPQIDGREKALVAEALTKPEGSVRMVFRWNLQEPGLRLSGDGVIRMESPYKARLDLFTDQGEGVARAALVNDDLRLPPEAVEVPLPPPPLFWATLGIFRPGTGAALLGANAEDGGTLLRYGYVDGRRMHFLMQGRRISRVELRVNNAVEEEVLLEWAAESPVPTSARYRLMRQTRELSMTLERVEDVESYPPDIWAPGG